MQKQEHPMMVSIPEAAKRTGLSQHYLRRLVNQGKFPCVRSGKKLYLNFGMLLDILNDPDKLASLNEM